MAAAETWSRRQTVNQCISVDHDTLLKWLRLVLVDPSSASYILLVGPHTVRPYEDNQLNAVDGPLWSAKGLVLGPILFLLYTADLLQLVNRHHLHPHVYADSDIRFLQSSRRRHPS